MALPTDSNDTFFREVDENLRRDQLSDFVKKYGVLLIGGLVLFLVAIGGWIYWQNQQREQAATQSEELMKVYADIGAERLDEAPQQLATLAESDNDLVSASARFAAAAVALERGNRADALKAYQELQADEDLPEPHRNMALVRMTALAFDQMKPEDVVARMQPLAQAGNPWFGSAGELMAMAYLKQDKKLEAARLFAAIAADAQVPETIRGRAVQFAGSLGIDASASMPTTTP